MKERALIVDDDRDNVDLLLQYCRFEFPEIEWSAAISEEEARSLIKADPPAIVILDLALDSRGTPGGFQVLSSIITKFPWARVIVLTGHSGSEHGMKAVALGAAHFIAKPAALYHLKILIHDCIQQARLRSELYNLRIQAVKDTLIGESSLIKKVKQEIAYAASNSHPVLLLGETGTGKGIAARAIHKLSARRSKNFVRYQPNFCSADLIQSELFGHTKGSFTGAAFERKGLISDACGGSLFLDEVDELPSDVQVLLLEVLQEKRYRVIGSSREENAEFRLIAATNQPLNFLLEKGKLRRDLYHRISFTTIEIPALRKRPEDIPSLSAAFLANLRDREECAVFALAEEVHPILKAYNWPGNVRELQAQIEGAALRAQFAGRSVILLEDVKIGGPETHAHESGFYEKVAALKRALVIQALTKCEGNQVKAAKDLGVDRSTLRRIIGREELPLSS
jgi:DNA-binding NtrC family response regulator